MGSTAFGVPTSEWSVDLDMLFGLDTEINLGGEFDFEKDLVQSNVAGGVIPAQDEKGGERWGVVPRGGGGGIKMKYSPSSAANKH